MEIERVRRGTAYRNMMKRYSAKAALERELERLIEEWSRCNPSFGGNLCHETIPCTKAST